MAQQLFGLSFTLPEFPLRRDIRGIGMSDALQYAGFLEHKFDYTNTYYHQPPKLDIMNPDFAAFSDLDFIISSDVFEHVLPPVSTAFENSYKLLNKDGFLLLTVPYFKKLSQTIERYPDINEFEVFQDEEGEYLLRNTTRSGEQQLFDNLIFHGGPGSTLEMRRFSEAHVLKLLEQAGFSSIEIFDRDLEQFGIIWKDHNSLPIIARK
jgi:SAM-dependent methyltransferase